MRAHTRYLSRGGSRIMSNRLTPPFRADHVGSLLRPRELVEAREGAKQGRISEPQLKAVTEQAVRDVVRMQEDIGLQSITDGEFTRDSWLADFLYSVGGVEKSANTIKVTFQNAEGSVDYNMNTMAVTGKLHLSKLIFGEAFAFLKAATNRTAKLTIPSPSMMHFRIGHGAVDPKIYPDLDTFLPDVVAVYREEMAGLRKLGCTYLQMDDTRLAYLNDPVQRDELAKAGGDPHKQHLAYIKRFNEVLAAKPAGMAVTTHLCRGNFRSSWAASGSYDFVAEALFNELNVDGFFLEFDDERSGSFAPLRFVPKGKMVVLGLVTTKNPTLETKDTVKRRIDEAAKFMPLEQICISPQCGFSSTIDGNALTRDQQIAKLKLVVDVARDMWGSV
jgi:5-methyltetrahydropteroyltriglutamate--homocysteine methyltransferase